jgi:K+-transporting ATPase ATPase A chain
VIRGVVAPNGASLGNFRVDLTRPALWILLPLSVLLALFLAWQAVRQTLLGAVVATGPGGREQIIARRPPVAQSAIRQLGTNGGGFFGVESAHPFENPTIASNMAQLLSILLIPVAFRFLFGRMGSDRRQGRAIFAAMAVIHLSGVAVNPALGPGANIKGKEQRFGAMLPALRAASATTATDGPVIAMQDGFMPMSGLVMPGFLHGGTNVFPDWRAIRATAEPGKSFLDRMIALNIPLAGFTLVLLLVWSRFPPLPAIPA